MKCVVVAVSCWWIWVSLLTCVVSFSLTPSPSIRRNSGFSWSKPHNNNNCLWPKKTHRGSSSRNNRIFSVSTQQVVYDDDDTNNNHVTEKRSRFSNFGLFRQSASTKISRLYRGFKDWIQVRGYRKIQHIAAVLVLGCFLCLTSKQGLSSSQPEAPLMSRTAVVERVEPLSSLPQQQSHSNDGFYRDFVGRSVRGGSGTTTMTRKKNEATDSDYHELSIFKPKLVEENLVQAGEATSRTLREAIIDLGKYMRGPKSDALILLLCTALVTPICKKFGTNPILGFLGVGMLLGPNGFGLIRSIHTTEVFAELGIVFFLFEMGIELSIERLMQMRKDVFGLGLGQFLVTGVAIAGVCHFLGLPANAQMVVGGGMALSSSAFVLQLLKDKNQLATRFGKASFGILLFQDLAVVPLLVVTPILAGSGTSLTAAVGSAIVKAGLALGSITLAGRFLLNPFFQTVAEANSQEAFLGLVLLTVLSMSFMTEGLGLSNTLGAFLAGVLLSETKYRYQVEADIAPFRGILLGLFFVTVGYEIDLGLIAAKFPVVASVVVGIMGLKAIVTTALSLGFGLRLPTSLQTGLILSQGGEFAFVAFGLARSLGILDKATTKLLLTSGSLTMALTPLMASLGAKIAKRLEESTDFTHYLGQDADATEIKNSDGFAVVVGYGQVGKVVCNLLDRKLIKYVGLEIDPNKAIQARNQGLPVFYGDIGRQEVAEAFNVRNAKIVIVCISDRAQATRVVIALRRFYPDLKIFCRAVDADHASRLQNTLNVAAMVPVLPEDTMMMTLPFGAAVMRSLGVPIEEVTAIIENKKREVMMKRSVQDIGEEAMLVQLGIANFSYPNIDEEDYAEREKMREKAAAERRQQALTKSPFVASVIQDACPDSICIEDVVDEEDDGVNDDVDNEGDDGAIN